MVLAAEARRCLWVWCLLWARCFRRDACSLTATGANQRFAPAALLLQNKRVTCGKVQQLCRPQR